MKPVAVWNRGEGVGGLPPFPDPGGGGFASCFFHRMLCAPVFGAFVLIEGWNVINRHLVELADHLAGGWVEDETRIPIHFVESAPHACRTHEAAACHAVVIRAASPQGAINKDQLRGGLARLVVV